MNTEEKVIYLGVKIGELAAHLNVLRQQFEEWAVTLNHLGCVSDTATQERDARAARFNELDRPGLGPVALGMRITDLEIKTDNLAERVAELEKPLPVGEWVKGNGLLPDDAYETACT